MSSVETLGALERRLNAFIPQQQIRGEIEARLKHLGRTAKIHGFRPGKVPLKILQQQYGAQVQQEVLGDALHRSFAESAQANALRVAGNPNFEIKNSDPAAEQLEYTATFEVYPEIAVGDVGAETVERVSYELSDTDIDNTLTTLRKQRAIFEPADRAVQDGDQVRIDFSGTLDGAAFEGGTGEDVTMVLGAGRMLPEFEQAIIGMKAGETKSFDMTFPEDYHGRNVAGKQVTFTIKLHGVDAPRLPELDVEFAKSLGIEDGDINKLKAEIRGNLGREVERRLQGLNKNNAMEVLLKVTNLDVPKVLVDAEIDRLMQQSIAELQERGMKIPAGVSLPAEMFIERAQKRVKLGLILADLVKRHNLTAKPAQIKELVKVYAQSFEHPEEVIKWHYSDPSRLKEVENMVLEDNVVAWVMATAKVQDTSITFNELMGQAK
ncbi:MAG: trigger factor [Pseudomonadota bacterium]